MSATGGAGNQLPPWSHLVATHGNRSRLRASELCGGFYPTSSPVPSEDGLGPKIRDNSTSPSLLLISTSAQVSSSIFNHRAYGQIRKYRSEIRFEFATHNVLSETTDIASLTPYLFVYSREQVSVSGQGRGGGGALRLGGRRAGLKAHGGGGGAPSRPTHGWSSRRYLTPSQRHGAAPAPRAVSRRSVQSCRGHLTGPEHTATIVTPG